MLSINPVEISALPEIVFAMLSPTVAAKVSAVDPGDNSGKLASDVDTRVLINTTVQAAKNIKSPPYDRLYLVEAFHFFPAASKINSSIETKAPIHIEWNIVHPIL